jgi:pSer/pThr/pTyr-binding forkhead associated (FHA) protein
VEGETDSKSSFPPELVNSSELPPISQGLPFVVIEDDWGKREVILDAEQYTIGRDPKSDICLHSQFASRQHAFLTKITQEEGTFIYQITDGNLNGKPSTNGLLINGQKQRTWELKPEDTVVFGPNVRIIFRLAPIRSNFL